MPQRYWQRLDTEAMLALGPFAQYVMGLELPVEAPPALHRPDGVGGKHRREAPRILALPGQPQEPTPGHGDALGDVVGAFFLASDTTEAELGVDEHALPDGKE